MFQLIDLFLIETIQLEGLNSQGYEIILVTSGAVGAGRQRLKYRRLINSRSDHLLWADI